MDEIKICEKCGAKILAKYNAFPGSSTETEYYDCPMCDNFLFSSRDSGYYTLSIVSDKIETCNKESIPTK